MTFDETMMSRCLTLAAHGAGHTSPNPMVGCVITRNEHIISEGYHTRCGAPHAEREAIAAAANNTQGATLYVNLEPCCHHGRTPPCTDAIIAAGIQRVVIGILDPNPLVAGQGIAQLKQAGIDVECGVLEAACLEINEAFLHHQRTGMPFVTYKYAMTLDGVQHIGRAVFEPEDRMISSAVSNAYVQDLRHSNNAIMIGANTLRFDDPLLSDRSTTDQPAHPLRIIIAHHAEALLHTRILKTAVDIPTLLATTHCSASTLATLQANHIEVLQFPEENVPLQALLKTLAERGINSILLEGGHTLASQMLRDGLVQKLHAIIAPKLFAAQMPCHTGGSPNTMQHALPVRDLSVIPLGDDLLLTAYL